MLGSLVVTVLLVSGSIFPSLQQQLDVLDSNESVRVIVHMKDRADLACLPDYTTKQDKIIFLQQFSQQNQEDLIAFLRESDAVEYMQSFWIFNGIVLTTTKQIIMRIAKRCDVDYIIDDAVISMEDSEKKSSIIDSRVPEWNIMKIKADSCWDIGFDGTGTIIGMMDTGVDTSHPALQGKFIPGGWFDAVNGQPNPYDDHGHGTFVMGIICGGDGNGSFPNDIGVAPGAGFKVAKIFNASGSAQLSWIHAAFQWFATQDAQTINNSWGVGVTTSLEFWDDCLTLRNLGILQAFSVGGGGPGSGTAATPSNYPTVTGVGATDSLDNIASFSGRGPAPNQAPWSDTQYWGRPDWNLIKPDIAAPGVNIRSSWPGMGYVIMSGTSWSTAHVTGAYAILLQKDSTATYGVLYSILLDYADEPPQGAPYPNNDYGWGRVNVFAALNEVGSYEYGFPGTPFLSSFQVYPNPFSAKTRIEYSLKGKAHDVKISIFDVSGRLIKSLNHSAPETQGAAVFWDGSDDEGHALPSGTYFIEIKSSNQNEIRSILLIR